MAGTIQDDAAAAPPGRSSSDVGPPWAPSLDVALVAAVTVAVRVPALLASRHLTFDDGVYGASAVAMRNGGVPFRDVFSSQGPLHLPLVRAADLLGLEASQAPRLLPLLAGLAAAILALHVGRLVGGRVGGLLAGLLVTVSGSFLWVSSAIHSDSAALALALGAVLAALRYRESPTWRTAILAGAMLGAGIAAKSVVLHAAVPVALLMLPRRHLGHMAAGAGATALVGIATALPFGLADVVDQAFTYHTEAATGRTPGRNVSKILSTLVDRDPVLVAALVAVIVVALASRRHGRNDAEAPSWRSLDGDAWLFAWLASSMALLLYIHPLWRPHLSHLVIPIALLVARRPPDRRLLIAAAAVLLPLQLVHVSTVAWPTPYEGAERRIVDSLRTLPDGAQAISDEPGLVWRAGLATPPDLVDTSLLRVESGRITERSLLEAAADEDVCALVVTSLRFGRFEGLADGLEVLDYRADNEGSLPVAYLRSSTRCASS